MATHSSILPVFLPGESHEPGRLQSMELQRVRHFHFQKISEASWGFTCVFNVGTKTTGLESRLFLPPCFLG